MYFNNFWSKNFSCKVTWLLFLPVTAGAPSVQILPHLNQSSLKFWDFFPLLTICHIFNKFSQFFQQVWGSSVEQNGQRPSNFLIIGDFFLTRWATTVNCSVSSIATSLGCEQRKQICMNPLKIECMLFYCLISPQPFSLSCCVNNYERISCVLFFWSGLCSNNWCILLYSVFVVWEQLLLTSLT